MVSPDGKTTIMISKKFKEYLKEKSIDNESYEETIKRLIPGDVEKYDSIYEAPAIILHDYEKGENIFITWQDLRDGNVGDVFDADIECESMNHEFAEIVYHDEKSALLKITLWNSNNIEPEKIDLLNFNFI